MREISKPDEHEADLKLRARLLPELYDTRSSRPFSKMAAENSDKLKLKRIPALERTLLL